ncbi:MAG: hypothetical protein Q4F57_03440 [Weeksellaceae bacterium]|nr:hypothetical protein [Weeksellaceae bacterium]
MLETIPLARQSTESIERIYITMRHLFYRGKYKINGTTGVALRNLLLKLDPEIYGSMNNPHKVELDGLLYVLDRLPQGIEECSFINLTANEGLDEAIFTPIIPPKRRRNCYRIDEDQMNIEIMRGRSEIYDILTHLTFFYNEADKIRRRAFTDGGANKTRIWQKIEEVVMHKTGISRRERDIALIHLANILGRTFQETLLAYKLFATDQQKDRLFHIVYWMGELSQKDVLDIKDREVSFTTTLRAEIGHHISGEKWANQIKSALLKHDLHERPLHIISSNMHSVLNMLFAHDALAKTFEQRAELGVYQDISAVKNREMRKRVKDFALENNLIYLDDKSGANIHVQILDLKKVNLGNSPLQHINYEGDDVLIVMDYAFGEQAFEVMDELLKPYKGKTTFKMNVKSISIMGKAGILEGKKGDIMVPTSHVYEGTADNYPFQNALSASDFKGYRLGVSQGMMVTVLGTSLQNKSLLSFFKNTSWSAIGLEMEGAHYQKAIQIASKIRNHIDSNVVVRYAYYASDNPLETGSTLASGGLGLTGVKPTYLITQRILEQILNPTLPQ